MVIIQRILIGLLLICLPALSWATEVKVTTQIIQAVENTPIEMEIDIAHDKENAVDTQSFQLDNAPLKVDLVEEKAQTDGSILSKYSFQIPGKSQGIFVLPIISVTVDGKPYSSIPLIYAVPTLKRNMSVSTSPKASASLRLETIVRRPLNVYPGQKLQFVYRIYYRPSVDLTVEKLPLLDATGFQKVGQKEIKDSVEGDTSVQEISQEVRALQPGSYLFPASTLEGLAYQEDETGKHYLSTEPYKSESPAMTIIVSPFPPENKPTSFNGALGKYEWAVKLLTPTTISVGDEIKLSLDIYGTGELSTISLPDLKCQPGFSGFFKIKMPPFESFTENARHFEVTLIPLNNAVHEIPSIEFSFFDPATSTYHVLQSQSLALKINELQAPSHQTEPQASIAQKTEKKASEPDWEKLWRHPPPSDIKDNVALTPSELTPYFWKTSNALLIIPFGMIIIFLQLCWLAYQIRKLSSLPTSYTLFNTAMREANIPLLEKAFMMRLYEKGLIPAQADSPDNLPQSGIVGDVKRFLTQVQQQRFSGATYSPDLILAEAKKLFRQISKAIY